MANPVRQARMPPELDDRLNEWAGERGIRESEAMRRLLEAGLDAEQADDQPATASYLAESLALILAMGAAVLAPLSVPLPALWPFAIAYLVVALVAFAGVLWSRGVRPPGLPVADRLDREWRG